MIFKPVAKQLDFPALEHRIQSFWDGNDIVAQYLTRNKGRKKWSFQDGPITANNPMGVHHAWGRTYKDIFQRYKTMKGFDQRYQNGFDCQGLWVEVEVERELGFKSKRDIEAFGIDRFVEKCRERVHKYSMVQTASSIRIGMWMDWGDWQTSMDDADWMKKSHSYYTMSEVNNYTIWHFLRKCHERGFIYEGVDVMPWCGRCGTAISDMEIATEGYKELCHKAVIVRFPVVGRENEYLLVWTTTPWTLTSNTGVAVHPDLTYVKVRNDGNTYYLAKNLVRVLRGEHEIVEEIAGKELLDLTYRGSFDNLPAQQGVVHKVIPWEEVSESEGSGLVHIAPGCGKEDFALGKEFKLATIAPLDELGVYVEGFDWLSGRDVRDVAGPIIEDLKDRGLLYHVADYSHRYPVCWRCNSELIFRLVDEWFISMDVLRSEIADVARKVERWIPEFGLARELDWLSNMADWCISKKRYWGLALPIWKCDCGHFAVIGSREELKEKAVEGREEFCGHSPHRPWIDKVKIKCEKCGAAVARVPDVGNPWLDAGIVPYSTIRPPDDMHRLDNGYPHDKSYWQDWFPADLITENFPGQFRNWFYAILTMSTVLENRPPFKVLHSYASLRDEHGEEMHKSKGNAIWSDDAAAKVGADVMRWMFAKHNIVQNLNFGYAATTEVKRNLLTLWNVYSFFVTYANIDGFNPAGRVLDRQRFTKLDRWILSRTNSLIAQCDRWYEAYDVTVVAKAVEVFFDDLSNWYVRRNRRRFWKSESDEDKSTAYLVLYECLIALTKLIAPIMPFLAEEIYQNLVVRVDKDARPRSSVHLGDFPVPDPALIDEELEREVSMIRTIVSLGRAARNKVNIKIRQPLAEMIVKMPDGALELAEDDKEIVLEELNVKEMKGTGSGSFDELSEYRVTPRFDRLGPRLGKVAGQVAAWIRSLGKDEIQKFVKYGSLKKEIGGEVYEIGSEDVEVKQVEKPDWAIATQEDFGVAVSTCISRELEDEGMVRELIHKIQLMRKEADFDLVDRIKVFCETDARLKQAIDANLDYLKSETLAIEVSCASGQGDIERVLDINGIETRIVLQRIAST
ncbi:isoleucine--tRNA ligase [candidate division WOR-3 bacterium]|nr:isoleucine--tRNA ligase [candidate division WOR-3 bacterium]